VLGTFICLPLKTQRNKLRNHAAARPVPWPCDLGKGIALILL
jgi:hypothetical protein